MSTVQESNIKGPPARLSLSEPLRALFEFGMLPLHLPSLMSAQMGDGHTVLILPGFTASDASTKILRGYLGQLGYAAEPWRLGRNLGDRVLGEDSYHLRQRVRELFKASGQKVSIIGWSLGGIMARRMAREHPEMVRQVISLASPFSGNPEAVSIRRFYEMVSGESLSSQSALRRFNRDREAPGVPSTSIYSRSDGITAWQNCLEKPGPLTDNIEVKGSHCGLVVNPAVFHAIADRLAQPEDEWKHFSCDRPLRSLFPACERGEMRVPRPLAA